MFAAAMKTLNYTTTWNGAKSYATPVPKVLNEPAEPDDGIESLISIFYKSNREVDISTLQMWFDKTPEHKLHDLIVLVFYIRDCRGGKGEREIGRKLLHHFAKSFPEQFLRVVHLIPEYGRYDDLIYLLIEELSDDVEKAILTIIRKQLFEDYDNMNKGEVVSLLAKWLPSENDSWDKKYNIVDKICRFLEINKSAYRKKYLSPLRAYLKIVETFMCSKKWDEIDFNKVPSCAMNRLKKAFEKNVPENYNSWKEGLKSGESKVNAKQLYPYEVIKSVSSVPYIKDEVVIEQWKVLEAETVKLGKLSKTVCVSDVSGSMTCNDSLPMHNSISLGLLISNCVEGDFHNLVISFSTNPQFFEIPEGDVYEKYNLIKDIEWGGTTDLYKVFKLILKKCQDCGLKAEDAPETLLIISDMQFDTAVSGKTNLESINELYKNSGYKRPKLVFWNVAGETTDFPATIRDDGTCLISGFSPSILESISNCEEINAVNVMMRTLTKERYEPIRKCLE